MIPKRFYPALAMLVLLLWIGFPLLASGHGYRVGAIRIVHPWAQITAPSITDGTSAVGYLVLRNTGDKPDRLLSAFAEIARKVELRAPDKVIDTPALRPVDSIEIPARGEIRLGPGGPHLVILGLGKSLEEGQRFSLELRFEHAGTITVDMFVQASAGDAIY